MTERRLKSSTALGERLFELLRSNVDNPDVVSLRCSDSTIRKVHRNVLWVSSEYFANIFTQKLDSEEIEVPCSSATFDLITQFLYTTAELTFQESNVIEIFATASVFGFTEIKDQTKSYLLDNLNICLQNKDFLAKDSPANVMCLTEIFRHPGLNCDKIALISRINRWRRTVVVDANTVVEIMDSLVVNEDQQVGCPRNTGFRGFICQREHIPFAGEALPTALFDGISTLYFLSSKRPAEAETILEPTLTVFKDIMSSIVVTRNYILCLRTVTDEVVLFDRITNELVRRVEIPETSSNLVVHGDKIYFVAKSRQIYRLDGDSERRQLIATTTHPVREGPFFMGSLDEPDSCCYIYTTGTPRKIQIEARMPSRLSVRLSMIQNYALSKEEKLLGCLVGNIWYFCFDKLEVRAIVPPNTPPVVKFKISERPRKCLMDGKLIYFMYKKHVIIINILTKERFCVEMPESDYSFVKYYPVSVTVI